MLEDEYDNDEFEKDHDFEQEPQKPRSKGTAGSIEMPLNIKKKVINIPGNERNGKKAVHNSMHQQQDSDKGTTEKVYVSK
jgi:hypothetical protein